MASHRTPNPARRRVLTLAALIPASALALAGSAAADGEQTCTGQVACVDEVVDADAEVGPVIGPIEFGFGG